MTPGSVLLITPRWTRDGGVATHVVASAAELASAGVDVHVLAARLELTETVPGVTLHRSPELFKLDAHPERRLGEAASLRPDVVHSHQFEDPQVLAHLGAVAPVVISVHGYSACASGVHYFRPGRECARAHGPGCVPNLLVRGCAHTRNPASLPSSYRRAGRSLQALLGADLAVSYSSTVDRHLAAAGVAERARVPLFPTVPPRTADGHERRRRVLFAGRIVAPKGVDVLVRAAREVQAEFVVCGEGRQLEGMRRLARRLRVHERVRFTGWLGAGELAQQMAEASLVAMPSRWPEPAGLVGIEAQAAGRPVVASATGGVSDWLSDGVNGMLVRPGDAADLARALRELLADPSRQAAMGQAGRRIVAERFSPELHVRALLDAYARARASWGEEGARERHDPPPAVSAAKASP